MKGLIILILIVSFPFQLKAQSANCIFKPPQIVINFGSGNIQEVNTAMSNNYQRIEGYCPNDGYYTYTNYTSGCFGNNWQTVSEDHTPGDENGNMLLINSSWDAGIFFITKLNGLKSGTIYQLALWLINVCKISDQCPYPLLPNITIKLQTEAGKIIALFGTGEVVRKEVPSWTQYRAIFTMPSSATSLFLVMSNNNPGGCGNDFALDDITLSACMQPTPVVTNAPKSTIAKKPRAIIKQPKKEKIEIVKREPRLKPVIKPQKDSLVYLNPVLKNKTTVFPPPPQILITRTNDLVKKIETEEEEIKIDLYDNGEIDGDTVSIYHNNTLLMAHARLSQKPITLRINVNAAHPHHELIMVAENLGTIPPNTSLMIITAGKKRYQVFISSTEQKNAKLVLALKNK